MRQLSLFGTSSGKGLLFSPGVLRQYLDDLKTTSIPQEAQRTALIREWLASLNETSAAEATLEAKFIQDIMVGVLGYVLYPYGGATASLYPKPPSHATRISRTPDAMLGAFTREELEFTVAVELKGPGTSLDLPQARHNSETPVEQGFYYGRRILGTQWVLVSDMRILRLYSVQSQAEYEEFDLKECLAADGKPTSAFRRLHFLLHHDFLVRGHRQAPVALLYEKTNERQFAIRDAFYQAYSVIRSDLHEAIGNAVSGFERKPGREELLEATQRLLDRMLFIYYCEDHPQHLIHPQTVKQITAAARQMPGPSPTKVYDALKYLFREVDEGSPVASGLRLSAYNGELFKEHWIIDHISLPDRLHEKRYTVTDASGVRRTVAGVWGLHEFDFWSELNEHLLGHIFEESLSDLEQLRGGAPPTSPEEKIRERKRNGIFYTSSLLSDFLCNSAILAVLDEQAPVDASSAGALKASLEARIDFLLGLRILDPACGSGAFLVSAFREMQQEYWRARAVLEASAQGEAQSLFDAIATRDQATLLRTCLYGSDLLPQAVEIAKLALWLRSARKGERVADLGGNIVSGDSLRVNELFARLRAAPNSFDVVVGNPPWGGEVQPEVYEDARQLLELDEERWDSWELFVLLGLRALREGGRLAFVLPDSFLYPEKAKLRRRLMEAAKLEKVYNLGADWFGKRVRMGTVVVQVRKGSYDENGELICALLAGSLRADAIRGKVPLTQIEAQRGRRVPLQRTLASSSREIEVLRGKRDDLIMERMANRSHSLSEMCRWARGEEINKAGLIWICPSCLNPTTPGDKAKGGGYKPKNCPECGYWLTEGTAGTAYLVSESVPANSSDFQPFIDGDDLAHRYQRVVPTKWMDMTLSGWLYKDAVKYTPPKLLVRQAGIGVVATLDETPSRCPQSVYAYHLLPARAQEGYSPEYVLAALVSRTMAYYVFKRFGEVDPAKAHSKLTHRRLATLPIPRVDFEDARETRLHAEITGNARLLLSGAAPLGGAEDRQIETALRELWQISVDDGAYINREFLDFPDSQVLRDLFPGGLPRGVPGPAPQSPAAEAGPA